MVCAEGSTEAQIEGIAMLNFFLKRFLEIGLTLFGITLISFIIIQLAPGKPTDVLTELNPKITPEARERLEKYYGLDKPIYVQYANWFKRVIRLDFGNSFSTDRRPVWVKIKERLPITIFINVAALFFMVVVAIPIGISSATHQYSLYDKVATVVVFIGFAIPTFWLALLLMMFFGVYLDFLPISGIKSIGYENLSYIGKVWDMAKHLILPITLSAFSGLAGLSRYMRSNMLEVIRQDYIITARAKG
ncbi:MAG: ABC transporter permease, partial [Thermodesulfobacteriota bacterium]